MSDAYDNILELHKLLPDEENEVVNQAQLEGNNKQEIRNFPREYDADYEMNFARKIYNRGDVQMAGKIALAKVSHLLISYNRMMDSRARRDANIIEAQVKAEDLFSKEIKDIFENYGIAEENYQAVVITAEQELAEEEEKKKEKEKQQDEKEEKDEKKEKEEKEEKENKQEEYDIDELSEEEKQKRAVKDYKKAKVIYNNELINIYSGAEAEYKRDIASNTNLDKSGGILSTLMLGGNAIGSEGYSLKSGDALDLMAGGMYIKKVASSKGTLFEQMALLDNAVNTNGIDLNKSNKAEVDEDEDDKAEDGEDICKLSFDANIGSSIKGAKYSLNDIFFNGSKKDIEDINASSYKQETMEGIMATEKISLDFKAIEKEKAFRVVNNIEADEKLSIKEANDNRKGISELNGKKQNISFYDEETTKMLVEDVDVLKPVPGLFGKTSNSSRELIRSKRQLWEQRMKKIRTIRSATNVELIDYKANKKDVDFKSIPSLSEEQLKKQKDALKENDKSVKNMIFAYKTMGASPKDLYLFRLAIIAYMIPAGKKTLKEILTESAEAGYLGNENLSSYETMYATFYDAPIEDDVYVNNNEKESSKLYRYKNVNLQAENTESKDEKEKRLAEKWKVNDEIVESEEEDKEEVAEIEIAQNQSEEINLGEEGKLGEKNEVNVDRQEQGNEINADVKPQDKQEHPVETIIKKFVSNGQRQNDEPVKIFKDLSVIITEKRLEFGLTEDDISLLEGHLKDESKMFKNGLLRIIRKVVEDNKEK